MSATIAVIGVPSSLGGISLGAENGPSRLREEGLNSRLQGLGLEVIDLGDVPVPARRIRGNPGPTPLARIASIDRWVAKHSWRALAEGMVPLVVGGDHSLAIGSIAAAAQSVPSLGVIWVDAHPDFNTPETTPSGNVHGMALAIVAGYGPTPLVRLQGFAPMVHPDRIVIIGSRSIDAGEAENLREAGVRLYDQEYLEEHGVQQTMRDATEYLVSHDVRAVHLSVDLDVLDPSTYPGVSTPALGGITEEQLFQIAEGAGETLRIASMDLAELTPSEDGEGATVKAALRVAEHALAKLARPEMTKRSSLPSRRSVA
jgi:arginase